MINNPPRLILSEGHVSLTAVTEFQFCPMEGEDLGHGV